MLCLTTRPAGTLRRTTSVLIAAILCATGLFGQTSLDVEEAPHLAIASLKFVRTSDGPKVELIDFVVVQTKKQFPIENLRENEVAYALVVTDARAMPLDTMILADPLNPAFEYPTDQGTLETVRIPQDVNHILVRFPYQKGMHHLQIAQIGAQQELHLIDTLTLPEVTE